jgi:hypothetical protein
MDWQNKFVLSGSVLVQGELGSAFQSCQLALPFNQELALKPGAENSPLLSDSAICIPKPIWRVLLMHLTAIALSLALESAGKSSPARIAMMAMTTRSSMSVNA